MRSVVYTAPLGGSAQQTMDGWVLDACTGRHEVRGTLRITHEVLDDVVERLLAAAGITADPGGEAYTLPPYRIVLELL